MTSKSAVVVVVTTTGARPLVKVASTGTTVPLLFSVPDISLPRMRMVASPVDVLHSVVTSTPSNEATTGAGSAAELYDVLVAPDPAGPVGPVVPGSPTPVGPVAPVAPLA